MRKKYILALVTKKCLSVREEKTNRRRHLCPVFVRQKANFIWVEPARGSLNRPWWLGALRAVIIKRASGIIPHDKPAFLLIVRFILRFLFTCCFRASGGGTVIVGTDQGVNQPFTELKDQNQPFTQNMLSSSKMFKPEAEKWQKTDRNRTRLQIREWLLYTVGRI